MCKLSRKAESNRWMNDTAPLCGFRTDKIGDLKPEMLADIIAVEGNPLNDIKALGRVAFVMKDGKIFKGSSGAPPETKDR